MDMILWLVVLDVQKQSFRRLSGANALAGKKGKKNHRLIRRAFPDWKRFAGKSAVFFRG